ncbi:MAG: hypothetical protein IPK32_17020, partial [Verrucomicrobiaceae bacterium]|nr:hypothetical protein [Verrucomicrobiaceae bacterium]
MHKFLPLLLSLAASSLSARDLGLEAPVVQTAPGPEYADQVRPGNMIIG